MAYDPFVRGPFPVGVRSGRAIDAERDCGVDAFVHAPSESIR
jgi:hypothetical protein